MSLSQIGSGDADNIKIRGHDLVHDLMGKHDFTEMVGLMLTGTFPDPPFKRMLDMFLLSAADHGLTPSAMSARLTLHGAPESVQGALAAGLLGAGSRYLGVIEHSARFLRDALPDAADKTPEALLESARDIVKQARAERRTIPGIGHPIHVEADPRCERMFEIARENGYFGNYCLLAQAIATAASEALGRKLPLNATGAKGAIALDMGLTPTQAKALTLIGRSNGLLAHIIEEQERPVAQTIWDEVSRL